MHLAVSILALVLLVLGIFMAFVPMLPALPYMFVIALAFAFYDGFSVLSGTLLFLFLALVVISIAVDHTAGIIGAKYGGAHTKSLLWGIAAAFLGTFTFPPFGTFIGLFLGVLGAELYYKKSHHRAIKAAGSALLGTLAGVAVNVVLAIIFVLVFLFTVIF